jgi:hypothetical protein
MIALAVIGMMTATNANAQKNATKLNEVYAFGFAASFNDSTVYFTDIQKIDKATLEKKTNFLPKRNEYTAQLRDYLARKGYPNRTCIISYASSRKNIEKKFVNFRKRYIKGGHYDIKYIAANDFQFQYVASDEVTTQEVTTPKKDESKKNKGPRPPKGKMGMPPSGNGGMPPMR